tara:strand:- start:822 stop:1181 length:360 start_codon:yes stop_codon:yes gene_type:complete
MSNRFVSVPAVPTNTDLSQQITVLIENIKENVELLTGLRDEADRISKSITQGQIEVGNISIQNMQQVSAKGAGFTISGQDIPSLEDYNKLRQDVQTLAEDVKVTRTVLNTLITQLKGTT